MSTLQKTALSLLISILLFGILFSLAWLGLVNFSEFNFIASENQITDGNFLSNRNYISEMSSEGLYLLFSAIFLTLFLTIFLILNIKQDPAAIIQNRMKNLWSSIIEQFYDENVKMDWVKWNRVLEQKRGEINSYLKRGIKQESHLKAIDDMMNRSWKEMLSITESREEIEELEDSDEILSESLAEVSDRFIESLPGKKYPSLPSAADPGFAELEEISSNNFSTANSGIFFSGRHYFSITGNNIIEDLEVISSQAAEIELAEELFESDEEINEGIFEEKNGVHYIIKDILNPASIDIKTLNKDFKSLVDSVLKP